MRQCTGKECLGWFPATLEYFYKTKGNKIGLTPECIECSKKRTDIYQEKNRESVLFSKRRYRDANKEVINIRAKAYIKENLEEVRANYRNWQQSPDGKEIMKKNNKFRSDNKKHEIKKSEWILCKEFFDNKCAYCGLLEEIHKKLYKQQLHKDHYQHDGSNTIDNCIPACKICNSTKHDKNGSEWYMDDLKFYTVERYDKIQEWLMKFQ